VKDGAARSVFVFMLRSEMRRVILTSAMRIASFLFVVLVAGVFFLHAEVRVASAEFLTDADRARLQTEYDKIQAEIVEWQKILTDTRTKKDSLQGDVTTLNALINKATGEIKQRNITITRLSDDIKKKTARIGSLEDQLNRGKSSLANMLRLQHEADEQSLAELILSAEDFSSFFGDLDALAVVRRDLEKIFNEVRTLRDNTEAEKEVLTVKQNQELNARHEVEVTKKQIAVSEAEKSKLLSITKDQEKTYQTVLAERQRKSEQIRSALFPLRDVEGISFGDALEFAALASEKTGVRAALILAVLSQESDLGKNIGSCYVTNLETGNGVGKKTGRVFERVMKSPRDTGPFERITNDLGLLWGATAVSCPLGVTYTSSRGFGGAMGPSQFIPSTWVLYEKRLKSALGISLPNPWDAKHAIMATALFLEDLGADKGTYTGERNAACRYYSGRSCDARAPINYTYGNSVVAKADDFQSNIDFLKGI